MTKLITISLLFHPVLNWRCPKGC